MYRLAITSQKGGVAKTTTAVTLAASLANSGKRVLLIDADYQSNAASQLDRRKETDDRSLAKVFTNQIKADDAIVNTAIAKLDIAAVSLQLLTFLQDVSLRKAREGCAEVMALKNFVDNISPNYDVCIIDSHPGIEPTFYLAMLAAEEFLIPVFAEGDALDGVSDFFAELSSVKKVNQGLESLGVVITKFDSRNSVHTQVREVILANQNLNVLETIPFSKAIYRTAIDGTTLAKSGHLAVTRAYDSLAKAIMMTKIENKMLKKGA